MTDSPEKTTPGKMTPAMRQFHHFKGQYPDAVLFFRMGDFYETFYDDAKTCARVLGITLTSRGKDGDNPIPLAGVPHHSVNGYLQKMIKAGYKVAVCEQVEDPKQAKGVVKRDVVRLVTAGTLTEDALLDERRGNFLAAVCYERTLTGKAASDSTAKEWAGLAYVELSTGLFCTQRVEARFVLDELVRLQPAECLVCEEEGALPKNFKEQCGELLTATLTPRPSWVFDKRTATDTLTAHFGTANLEGFGFAKPDCAVAAAGALVAYLNETQKTALGHIAQLRRVSRDEYLQLDQTTMRSLELERTIRDGTAAGSLLRSLDKTLTPMGARKIRHWLCYPLSSLAPIERRQAAVGELVQFDAVREAVRKLLADIGDIERIASRVSTGRASPRDLLGLCRALRQLPAVREQLTQCSTEMLTELAAQCDTLEKTADLIEAAIDPEAPLTYRDGGVIRIGFDEQVDHLRAIGQDGKTWLAEYQKRLSDAIGFANLKVGFNRVFGYYVEITHAFRGELPGDFVRKQTLKNAERYITDELKKYESEALTAEQRCKDREEELFQQVRKQVAAQTLHLQQVADAVAHIDVLACLAEIARTRNYCRPVMREEGSLKIVEGRHPVLDVTLGNQFVPNDITLGGGEGDLAIITGPNMSGKSTYIRQTALLVLLAHTGSFIPAQEAEITLTDRIFTRVGASDEITRGQSTFMVEMTETANIINNATARSLIILDEIGRGTSTYDGLALAWAITEHLATKIVARTLFATHYHELTELADLLENVKNLNVAVREWKDDVVFMHKIVPGRTDKSYGIHVARLAGVPQSVLKRSQTILEELEETFVKESHGPQLAGRLPAPEPEGQLLLFTDTQDPIVEKLSALDMNNLTPIQAINLLHEIKEELENR